MTAPKPLSECKTSRNARQGELMLMALYGRWRSGDYLAGEEVIGICSVGGEGTRGCDAFVIGPGLFCAYHLGRKLWSARAYPRKG